MHIDVSDILARDVGYRTGFKIVGERPMLEDATLLDDITGELTLTRVEDGLLSGGGFTTAIELECHRCLSMYAYSTKASLAGEFAHRPTVDQWPIEDDETIDLAPLVRQELLVSVPIKQLCRPDCPGLAQQGKEDNGSTKKA